jgi:hypothetical protein
MKCSLCRCVVLNSNPCLKCFGYFHKNPTDYSKSKTGCTINCFSAHSCKNKIVSEDEEESRREILKACFARNMQFQNSTFFHDNFIREFINPTTDTKPELIDAYLHHSSKWNECSYEGIELVLDEIKGYCVFSTKVFKQGDIVCEYGGEVTFWGDCATRGDFDCILTAQYHPIFPSLDLVVFPIEKGDAGRFFNHGNKEDANLEMQIINIPIELINIKSPNYSPMKCILIAKETIKTSTELVWNYNSNLNNYTIDNEINKLKRK